MGTSHVLPGAREVVIYPDEDADERGIALALAGIVCVFILHQRGFPTLHASAVETPLGSLAFLGRRGQGKSTMAALFLQQGSTLITDDVLPLDLRDGDVYGIPSLPYMKVWRATAEGTLGVTCELPDLMANYDKKLFTLDGRFSFADAQTRLRGFYVIERYDSSAESRTDVTIEPLRTRGALAALLGNISDGAFLRPAELATLLPIYTRVAARVPIRKLRFPNGFHNQAEVHARIMADVATVDRV